MEKNVDEPGFYIRLDNCELFNDISPITFDECIAFFDAFSIIHDDARKKRNGCLVRSFKNSLPGDSSFCFYAACYLHCLDLRSSFFQMTTFSR